MSRWFRMYDDLLNDPKVQRLSPELFKLWVNCLCVASKHEGRFPSWQDMAFMMRMDVSKLAKSMQSLMDAGLIDSDSNGSFPHGWENRQFKSDVSNERVSRFRERKRNAQCNVTSPVTVTPPDTDTESEYRTEQKVSMINLADFDSLWSIYPKRGGSPAKALALRAFRGALGKGASLSSIFEGALRYAEGIRADGKEKTPFVAQMATWLNQERWNDEYVREERRIEVNDKSAVGAAQRLAQRTRDREADGPVRPVLSIASG